MQASRSERFALLAALLLPVAASASLSGTIRIADTETKGFTVHDDHFEYAAAGGDSLRRLPAFEFAVVEEGGVLIPLAQGLRDVGNAHWEIALQPGRAWASDDAIVRAALPFALIERNANCTHNGVLSWGFGENGQLVEVLWQIGGETCAYFKFDAWGTAQGRFRAGAVRGADAALDAWRAHVAARLPVVPIDRIGERYPQVEPAAFGAVGGMQAGDMSVYGFIAGGVHYRSGCSSRLDRPYPFCDELLLPSYSTAKSIFAGLALMRLERLFPGSAHRALDELVPACGGGDWSGVTIEHALDMATGHYEHTGLDVDEGIDEHVAFLYATTHDEKIHAACSLFPRRAPPGERFVYHTSDTYLAGTGMQALLKQELGRHADIYTSLLVEPVFSRLHLSAIAQQTRRTYDAVRQPFAGWGLTFIPDDVARLADWLNAGGGRIDGEALLDAGLFDAAMQRAPDDRGLPAPTAVFRYNNGFWAHDVASYIGCDRPVWVPFMSGYGGISIVLFPNGTSYYYFSDGYTQRWREAAVAADRIEGMCP